MARFTKNDAATLIRVQELQGYDSGLATPLKDYAPNPWPHGVARNISVPDWDVILSEAWMRGFKRGRIKRHQDLQLVCKDELSENTNDA